MSIKHESPQGSWKTRRTFVLAATGACVGFANVWHFPGLMAQHGGWWFLILYLGCLMMVAVPIMIAELLTGRMGRLSPIGSINALVDRFHAHPAWKAIGWLGTLASLMVLVLYVVIGGMALSYIFHNAFSHFTGVSQVEVLEVFVALQADQIALQAWMSLFLLLVVIVSGRGVRNGIARSMRVLVPAIFFILLGLCLYGLRYGSVQNIADNWSQPDWVPTQSAFFAALRHAFFTLAVGMGVMVAFGAYMPSTSRITRNVLWVAVADTAAALLAAIFVMLVMREGQPDPGSGFELVFQTLPHRLSQLPLGALAGAMLFVLLSFVAWSSAIAVMEPSLSWVRETTLLPRNRAVWIVGILVWCAAWAVSRSLSDWQHMQVGGLSLFTGLSFLASGFLIPLAGAMVVLFVGWAVPASALAAEMKPRHPWHFKFWHGVLRWIAPAAVMAVFLIGVAQLLAIECRLQGGDACEPAPQSEPALETEPANG